MLTIISDAKRWLENKNMVTTGLLPIEVCRPFGCARWNKNEAMSGQNVDFKFDDFCWDIVTLSACWEPLQQLIERSLCGLLQGLMSLLVQYTQILSRQSTFSRPQIELSSNIGPNYRICCSFVLVRNIPRGVEQSTIISQLNVIFR